MRIRWAGALAGLALLSGCGGGTDLTAALQGAVAPLVGTQAAAPAVAGGGGGALDPATTRIADLSSLGVSGPARQVSASGGTVTHAGAQGFTYTMRDGMLVATRGIGDDLMAADARQSRAALRAGGGRATRVHETLDGLDRIVRAEFDCVIAPMGREEIALGARRVTAARFDERCEGRGVIFENRYWIDAAGEIVSSRQFVSQSVAYLRDNRL